MERDDRILSFTRIISVVVIPFLWLAFLILFFFPDQSGERFAWAIKPHMTSMFMAAGYLGGSWLFIQGVFGKRWHRIQGGFLPITAFTWFMMISTFLHWDRFSNNLGFYAWLILYIVTPFLVPALWYFNRKTDPLIPEEKDVVISPVAGWFLKLVSLGLLILVLIGYLNPSLVIQVWPWTLTPLTARVMCGWVALLGIGALTMSYERRWTGWKVPLESITIWHILVLVAAFLNPGDFKSGLLNWYTVSVGILLIAIFFLYMIMEMQQAKGSSTRQSSETPA